MNHKALIVSILLLASGVVAAQGTYDKGPYIGGAFGSSEFDDDGAFSGLASLGIQSDLKDTAWRLYGGYKIAKHIAIDVRLTDFGEFTLWPVFDPSDQLVIEATAVTVHALGILPLGNGKWELFGQLGVGQIDFEIDAQTIDNRETVGSAGAGVRFTPSEPVTIALQFDAYAWESELANSDPSISTAQLSVQYNFCAAANKRCAR